MNITVDHRQSTITATTAIRKLCFLLRPLDRGGIARGVIGNGKTGNKRAKCEKIIFNLNIILSSRRTVFQNQASLDESPPKQQ